MIEVRHLTKRYGGHIAVSDLSFTIEKGAVYGLLGPNGAGKSTTMNMMTGCLGATDGQVLIDGHSIAEEPMAAKRLVGYLPEQPPLYTDMTAEEYLRFVGRARGVPRRELFGQVERVMEKTRLTDMRARLIRNLSKGYRQRVGIAQALLCDPEIIILDEPTVGLDPVQIIEIRELIRELGHDHTLVLSSHILSEVQAVCDRIMIISKGRLVASDTPENLTALMDGAASLRLVVHASGEEAAAVLDGVEGIAGYELFPDEDGVRAMLKPAEGQDLRERLFCAFARAERPILEMSRERASLEDVFLELTAQDDSEAPCEEKEAQAE